jgi:hypothetical protein
MTLRQILALAAIGIAAFILFAFVIFPNVLAQEGRYYADVTSRPYNPAIRFVIPTGPPEGCTPIEPSGEGFPRVQCADGVWYRDMDGQIWANDAGYPVYPPGTWVPELAPQS